MQSDGVPARTPPELPPAALWAAACRDFEAGRVIAQTYRVNDDDFPVKSTLTFRRAYASAPLTETERASVARAVVMIGVNQVHPMLYCRGVPLEPVGATMGSPLAGVTVTWRLGADGVPVMLTLSVRRT